MRTNKLSIKRKTLIKTITIHDNNTLIDSLFIFKTTLSETDVIRTDLF